MTDLTKRYYLDCVEASVSKATKYINTNVNIVHATQLSGKLFRLLEARLIPAVVQIYTITDFKEQPVTQNKPT